jgi:hypothetical protein
MKLTEWLFSVFLIMVFSTVSAPFTARAQGLLDTIRGTPRTFSAIENAFNECVRRELRNATSEFTGRGAFLVCQRSKDAQLQAASSDITGQVQSDITGSSLNQQYDKSTTFYFDFYHNTIGFVVTRIQVMFPSAPRRPSFDCMPGEAGLPAKTVRYYCQLHPELFSQGYPAQISRIFGVRF